MMKVLDPLTRKVMHAEALFTLMNLRGHDVAEYRKLFMSQYSKAYSPIAFDLLGFKMSPSISTSRTPLNDVRQLFTVNAVPNFQGAIVVDISGADIYLQAPDISTPYNGMEGINLLRGLALTELCFNRDAFADGMQLRFALRPESLIYYNLEKMGGSYMCDTSGVPSFGDICPILGRLIDATLDPETLSKRIMDYLAEGPKLAEKMLHDFNEPSIDEDEIDDSDARIVLPMAAPDLDRINAASLFYTAEYEKSRGRRIVDVTSTMRLAPPTHTGASAVLNVVSFDQITRSAVTTLCLSIYRRNSRKGKGLAVLIAHVDESKPQTFTDLKRYDPMPNEAEVLRFMNTLAKSVVPSVLVNRIHGAFNRMNMPGFASLGVPNSHDVKSFLGNRTLQLWLAIRDTMKEAGFIAYTRWEYGRSRIAAASEPQQLTAEKVKSSWSVAVADYNNRINLLASRLMSPNLPSHIENLNDQSHLENHESIVLRMLSLRVRMELFRCLCWADATTLDMTNTFDKFKLKCADLIRGVEPLIGRARLGQMSRLIALAHCPSSFDSREDFGLGVSAQLYTSSMNSVQVGEADSVMTRKVLGTMTFATNMSWNWIYTDVRDNAVRRVTGRLMTRRLILTPKERADRDQFQDLRINPEVAQAIPGESPCSPIDVDVLFSNLEAMPPITAAILSSPRIGWFEFFNSALAEPAFAFEVATYLAETYSVRVANGDELHIWAVANRDELEETMVHFNDRAYRIRAPRNENYKALPQVAADGEEIDPML
jgi:hypothetical protein